VQPCPDLVGGVGAAAPLGPDDHCSGGGDTDEGGQPKYFPHAHPPRLAIVLGARITLDDALDLTRTGDVWLFRGHKAADRAIQVSTNSPVNHVGMSVVVDDLPPLMWHAELSRSLPDMWSGKHQRGVQLHDLRAAVIVWATRYGQRAWLRQLDHPITRETEDAVLRTIARLDGTPFPATARLASGWLRGRMPTIRSDARNGAENRMRGTENGGRDGEAGAGDTASRWRRRKNGARATENGTRGVDMKTAYCAEVVAVTYQAMGLLPGGRRPNWYDAGRFWSGDDLELAAGARLGGEIAVDIPSS
jgi:hypothetical protein